MESLSRKCRGKIKIVIMVNGERKIKLDMETYFFSLGAQQTRTFSRPIWSPTLLVSITSNVWSGGKTLVHKDRASPVHKITFK